MLLWLNALVSWICHCQYHQVKHSDINSSSNLSLKFYGISRFFFRTPASSPSNPQTNSQPNNSQPSLCVSIELKAREKRGKSLIYYKFLKYQIKVDNAYANACDFFNIMTTMNSLLSANIIIMALYIWSIVKTTYKHNIETNLHVKIIECKFLLDQFRKCTPLIF